MYQDLHTHTTLSDGKMSYQEVLDTAARLNISTVAFTDHDLVPPKDRLQLLEGLRDHETEWLVGVELSCAPPADLTKNKAIQLHVLGLFVDPTNPELIEWGKKIAEGRKKRMRIVVQNLKDRVGFDISEEEVLAESQGEVIQRPHLVAAVIKKECNIALIKKYMAKMREAAASDPVLAVKYFDMMKQSEAEDNPWRQPMYPLFLGHDAFVRGVYQPKCDIPSLDEGVKIIRNAGGVAILAHWSESKDDFTLKMLEQLCQEKRLDGAEVVYDLYRLDIGQERELREEQEGVRKIIEANNLVKSGGSDAHFAGRMEQMVSAIWFAEQTRGMVGQILEGRSLYRGHSTVKV